VGRVLDYICAMVLQYRRSSGRGDLVGLPYPFSQEANDKWHPTPGRAGRMAKGEPTNGGAGEERGIRNKEQMAGCHCVHYSFHAHTFDVSIVRVYIV